MTPLYELTEENMASVLEEWHRRWTEQPERFLSEWESLAEADDTYGSAAAAYFVKLVGEVLEVQS